MQRSIKSLIGRFAGMTDSYRRRLRSTMLIVAFHRVSNRMPEDGLTCSDVKFDEFCAFFKKHFRVVSFEDQVIGRARGDDMGGTLSITFDDGYLDNYEVAAPILLKHGLPATFFVTTGFIGSLTVPFWDKDLSPHPGWMTWAHLRSLVSQGFAIGAHTVSHIDMGTADNETIRSELESSRRTIERELGAVPRLFVYPFGGRDNITETSIELVRNAGFVSCASCHGGTNDPAVDPFHLKRIGIGDWFRTPYQFGAEILLGKV